MCKAIVGLCPLLAVIAFQASQVAAQQPALKDPRTYSIQCRLNRQAIEIGSDGRGRLATTATTLPDIVTIEGARTEYLSERKSDTGTFQLRVAALIQPLSEGRVRIDLQLEDTWSEGPLDKPVIHRHALMTTRIASLGSKIKIHLQEKNDRDELIDVDLTVKKMEDEK